MESRIAYYLMICIGIGYLFPLSALTQPVDYWHHVFPKYNVEFPITTIYMWVNIIVLGFIVLFMRQPSYSFRIVGGFIGQFIVLIFVPSLEYFNLNEFEHYYGVIFATAIAAIATALVDSVAIGFASNYPPMVIEGLQLGIGLSTLIGSIFRIATKSVFSPEMIVTSSIVYFYIGAVTILFCIGAYYYLISLPLSRKVLGVSVSKPSNSDTREDQYLIEVPSINYTEPDDSYAPTPSQTGLVDRFQVLKKVAFLQFQVVVIFFSSLTVWPGLITEIPTYNFPYLQETKWWSLLLLLLFSVFDCIGRCMTSRRFSLSASNIWLLSFSRLLFIPLLYLCSTGWYLKSDFISLVSVLCMGFTNGYVGSLCIIFISEEVRVEEKAMVGAFTGFSLNIGLVLGATYATLISS